MSILALDSGLERVGYAVFDRTPSDGKPATYITSGLIKTGGQKPLAERLAAIHDAVSALINAHKPQTLVLEKLFFFKNQKTVIEVAQAQGVTLLAAAQKGIPTDYLTPLQIKQIVTGYGSSDKKSVQKMLGLILKLDASVLKQDDRADAIACGLAYCLLNKTLVR